MFESLTQRLTQAIAQLAGQTTLSEKNTAPVLTSIRHAMLEADVALPVIDALLKDIATKAHGQDIATGLKADEVMLNVVRSAIVEVLQPQETVSLQFNTKPPAIILLAGLQGAGKTTTCAKLAAHLGKQKKSVMLVSTDTQRPGAIEQLAQLCHANNLALIPSESTEHPLDIAQRAMQVAQTQHADVLLIDTAGRLHIDDALILQLQQLHKQTTPIETLFVIDSMSGQDAANTAKVFAEKLPLTGIILTKMDGDSRGGAALSTTYITKCPVKFIGTSEKIDGLATFNPERIADQMLDRGDWMALLEKVQQHTNQQDNRAMEKRLKRGAFSLDDLAKQIEQMINMGGMKSLLKHMPGSSQAQGMIDQIDEKVMIHQLAAIRSMTKQEREHPFLLKGSRRNRVLKGSGTSPKTLNQLLKQHKRMQMVVKKLKGKDLKAFMEQHMGEK